MLRWVRVQGDILTAAVPKSAERKNTLSNYTTIPLFTDPEGDSSFSIYQIRWMKKRFFNFFFWNFRETMRHFSLCSQNSEYPRIFQVTGANQNARNCYPLIW